MGATVRWVKGPRKTSSSRAVHVRVAHGADAQVHSRPKYLARRSAAAAQAGHDAALAGLSPSVHSTPSKASRELSYGKSQPRRLSSRLRCLARFAANDFTAAARRTLAAFEATLAGGSVRMMRSARLPVISR